MNPLTRTLRLELQKRSHRWTLNAAGVRLHRRVGDRVVTPIWRLVGEIRFLVGDQLVKPR